MDNEKVRHFTISTNIVSAAWLAMSEDPIDASTMVEYIQPVPNIVAIAMDGDRLVVQDASDCLRNQLFSVLFGPIVVGTVGDHHFQAIGVVVGPHK